MTDAYGVTANVVVDHLGHSADGVVKVSNHDVRVKSGMVDVDVEATVATLMMISLLMVDCSVSPLLIELNVKLLSLTYEQYIRDN